MIANPLPNLPTLPVVEALSALRAALARDSHAVLAAPPGSGKTTLVPLLLLQENWLQGTKILMLEPRRIAARAAAARMASLLGERVGETIGYQIRFDKKVSAQTRVEVITEGVLTRRLQADADLPGVGLVIFDEFHERSLDADLALALTLDTRRNLRPDLRLLVMSATLDTARVAALLGGAEVIESGGRMFPVAISYAPPRSGIEPDEAVANAALNALDAGDGDVLVFLPGAREIRDAQRAIDRRLNARSDVDMHLLYGDLASAQQDAALAPAPTGRRKIILATNIAQTSLTIEGVTSVVDSGFARVARFDLGAGANRLETLRISRAAADQRAGRAGRLGPGACQRLWSRDQHAALPAHDTPEILAADLSRFALEVAGWGVRDLAELTLLDKPPASAWSYAQDLLRQLDALDTDSRITAHGRELARLPATPRIAHMLLLAQRAGLGASAAWVAAVLEQRSIGSDLAFEVERFRSGRGIDAATLARTRDTVRQLMRLIDADAHPDKDSNKDSDENDAVGRVVALAYPERIARRREVQRDTRDVHYLCVDGGEARLPARDAMAAGEWLAIAHWEPGTPRKIRAAASFDERRVLQDHARAIATREHIQWDAKTESVIAERQCSLGAIVLESRSLREPGDVRVRTAMIEGLRKLGLAVLPWSDAARQFQARVLSLRVWRSDEDWPAVDHDNLLRTLEDWLAPHLESINKREHLQRLDLVEILGAQLDYVKAQRLAKLAPTHINVPSGSSIALDYSTSAAAPVLAVKLQELFGLRQTPTVDDGRMPVALHLLSPGRRPIQVTQDLPGFWARTYPEVKKELKGRYPRHPWPDDPLAAPATARAKPRGT